MKKIRWIIFAAAAVILTVGLSGLVKAVSVPPETVIPTAAAVAPAGTLEPGTEVEFQAEITLPLNMEITGCKLDVPGSTAAKIDYRFAVWRWDRAKWKISGSFRTLANTRIKDAAIEVSAGKIWFRSTENNYTVPIPEIEVKLADNAVSDEELFLAPETESPAVAAAKTPWYRKKAVIIPVAVLIFIAAAGIAVLMFRKKKVRKLPLDRRIIDEIAGLKKLVTSGSISPAGGFTQLCDILRGYLEERFQLPVTKCTTDEFIRSSHLEMLLPERREQLFLTGFLNSADMIKFAGAAADIMMFDRAAAQVEELVQLTAPQEVKK